MSEPVFRSNKRRKVFRKRPDHNSEDGDGNPSEASGISFTGATDDEVPAAGSATLTRPRKHGIAFSSTQQARAQLDSSNSQLALVEANDQAASGVPQTDRFIRSTGVAVVAEDKHMSAYIDSNLAELRSRTATPRIEVNEGRAQHEDSAQGANGISIPKTGHLEQSASDEPAQLSSNTEQPAGVKQTSGRPPRRRREPIRSEADVARDSLVDQILQESQVPLYDRSEPMKPTAQPGGDGLADNDAAVAAAFKADFLAAMEERKLHRRAPAAAAPGATSGPKLGGSRSQRERMRAYEEQAKAKK